MTKKDIFAHKMPGYYRIEGQIWCVYEHLELIRDRLDEIVLQSNSIYSDVSDERKASLNALRDKVASCVIDMLLMNSI